MPYLEAGMVVPEFTGKNQEGKLIRLSDLKGKKMAIYFYPKDQTPGCTQQACGLRDNFRHLNEKGVVIIGISPDSENSHLNFARNNSLPFDLIADTDRSIIEEYGVWGKKKLFGKVFYGVQRTTFLVNENSTIHSIIRKVDTRNHVNQITNNFNI